MDAAQHADVRAALGRVLTHMVGGPGRDRRGGRKLLELLKDARATAGAAEEWQIVRLLLDSLDYAENRILRPDFEERYRLFRMRDEPRTAHGDFLSNTLSAALQFFGQTGNDYLRDHPGATAQEVMAHVVQISEDARFMRPSESAPGRFSILRGQAETAAWLEEVLRERIDIEDPQQVAHRIASSPEALAVLASDEEGQLLLRAAELKRRWEGLESLRRVAEDPAASELDLQRALEGQYWIFGGQYVDQAVQRRLVPGDEVDIPLIRGDGALHIVELKRSMNPKLSIVKRHRSSWVPTAEVHDAVSQAVNYLVGLDEHRPAIREEFGIETRRASATVLIGHPALHPEVSETEISDTFRRLNSHVNRVEVMTYKELIDNAARAMNGPAQRTPRARLAQDGPGSAPLVPEPHP
ncbi:DUF4263 domain-containing protein [Streptomyces sp. 3MP-14]|uniref:DUF4263 domain-containing protein n=2 Tax=Streptomyces TaxID=1883 RepID=A0A5N6AC56_9ACTN|nr:DUF4263 domain-containing protein [Streptomyces mimosae]KAB8175983.1 DUF4263 domain-containing protein [Streptomyces sp. 3MP-14]